MLVGQSVALWQKVPVLKSSSFDTNPHTQLPQSPIPNYSAGSESVGKHHDHVEATYTYTYELTDEVTLL